MLTCYLLFVYHILSVKRFIALCAWRALRMFEVFMLSVCLWFVFVLLRFICSTHHAGCPSCQGGGWTWESPQPESAYCLTASPPTATHTHKISNQEPCTKISTFQTCIHGFKLCLVHMKRLISLNKHWPIINRTSFTGKKTAFSVKPWRWKTLGQCSSSVLTKLNTYLTGKKGEGAYPLFCNPTT